MLDISVLFSQERSPKCTEMVKVIANKAEALRMESLFDYGVTFEEENPQRLTPNCLWILGASPIHLATFWHIESLAYLLKIKPESKNKETPDHSITPLHIASFLDNTAVIRLLIHCKVQLCQMNINQ